MSTSHHIALNNHHYITIPLKFAGGDNLITLRIMMIPPFNIFKIIKIYPPHPDYHYQMIKRVPIEARVCLQWWGYGLVLAAIVHTLQCTKCTHSNAQLNISTPTTILQCTLQCTQDNHQISNARCEANIAHSKTIHNTLDLPMFL